MLHFSPVLFDLAKQLNYLSFSPLVFVEVKFKQNFHYESVKAESELVNTTTMPSHFCVICRSVTVPYQISLFKFPEDLKVQQHWIQFVNTAGKFNQKNNTINCTQSQYICSSHFSKEDFVNFPRFRSGFSKKLFLKQGACPSVQFGSNGSSIDAVLIKSNQESIAVQVSLCNFLFLSIKSKIMYSIKKFVVAHHLTLYFLHVC